MWFKNLLRRVSQLPAAVVLYVCGAIKEVHEDSAGGLSWIRVQGSFVIEIIMVTWAFAAWHAIRNGLGIPTLPDGMLGLIGGQIFGKLVQKHLELKGIKDAPKELAAES